MVDADSAGGLRAVRTHARGITTYTGKP
jgi:hypothetical protein